MTAELRQIAQELQQLTRTHQQTMPWQQVMDHAETFRQLLGENLDQLAFEERQAVVQCLISKVVITGEEVDIYYVLPFGEAPQGSPHTAQSSEGTPGQFYRLRLAERDQSAAPQTDDGARCAPLSAPGWRHEGADGVCPRRPSRPCRDARSREASGGGPGTYQLCRCPAVAQYRAPGGTLAPVGGQSPPT